MNGVATRNTTKRFEVYRAERAQAKTARLEMVILRIGLALDFA